MALDPQAQQLNDAIQASNPSVLDMLSDRGKGIFFPKLGILSQSAAAKGKEINATIGTALNEDGSPMCLPGLAEMIALPTKEVFPYAPSSGLPEIRKQWATMMLEKNPGLQGKAISEPVVTSALTHGLSVAGYLFCGADDVVITPDLYWENYDLVFTQACGSRVETFATFTEDGRFNVAALKACMARQTASKLVVVLNFPNNPSGYTPTCDEVPAIVAALVEAAESGKSIVVLIDDAYFGLVYEPGVYTQSIFADLCEVHPRILAVKLDGPTKEDYVWGFRVGFITFGIRGGSAGLYAALEAKCSGAIRGNISNCSMPAQSMLLKAWQSETYAAEKAAKYDMLKARYDRICQIFAEHPEYAEEFDPLPFNSGYFMCVRPKHADPEALRQRLLAQYSTGLIALCGIIRIAFSSTPLAILDKMFANIYRACRDLK